ncbi:RBM7 protein, partial [Notiomystis cincta]|nr:RBM7 protein [Notiomystis cincta]
QAGPVITVKIPKDRDGRPKQFAFVNFKHEESVPYGLRLLNGIKLYGRPMRIQFRSGSSHAAQDINPSCSPLGAAGTNPLGMPHPASSCSRVPDVVAAPGFPPSLQRQAVVRACSHVWGCALGAMKWHPGDAAERYCGPAAAGSAGRALWLKQWGGRLGAHPYGADGRHFGRERFGDRGPDYGRGKRDEYGFEERGHEAEHHYRGGREEHYDDRHRDWSYEHRRESYREAKWHSARH